MPPINPPLKNDGPACRVCGCTEHNACLTDAYGRVGFSRPCSWVKTSGADSGPLCSACSGTAADLVEAASRAHSLLGFGTNSPTRARAVLAAAIIRYQKRKKGVDAAA